MSRVMTRQTMGKLLLIGVLSAQAALWAYDLPPLVAQEKDTSTSTLTIDSWSPKNTARPAPQPSPTTPTPSTKPPAASAKVLPDVPSPASKPVKAAAVAPSPAPAKAAVVVPQSTPPPPAAPRVSMNEMRGAIASIDIDASVIRLSVAGGFNPELPFDSKTVVSSEGKPLKVSDLEVGDKVIVRYMGRDTTAREIEKLPK